MWCFGREGVKVTILRKTILPRDFPITGGGIMGLNEVGRIRGLKDHYY